MVLDKRAEVTTETFPVSRRRGHFRWPPQISYDAVGTFTISLDISPRCRRRLALGLRLETRDMFGCQCNEEWQRHGFSGKIERNRVPTAGEENSVAFLALDVSTTEFYGSAGYTG